jgi:hypothetical protein
MNLIMRTEDTFERVDVGFFTGKVDFFYSPFFLQHSGNYFPAELQIIAWHPKTHHQRAYSISLDDLFDSCFRFLKANLIESWEAPDAPIKQIIPSPRGEYAALSDGNHIEVYKISAYHLTHIDVVNSQRTYGSADVISWFPDGNSTPFISPSS